MKMTRKPLMLAVSLAVTLALSACGKSNEPASPIPDTPPPSATVVSPAPPAPAASASASAAMSMNAMPAAVSISSVELGSAVDANHKVRAISSMFGPKDTVYASVDTMGNGSATLVAKWTYQDGQVVHEDSKVLAAMGPETTAFMISNPGGFPAGDYKVDISLDGKSVTSKDFSIK
jgi:hypothetical protein